MFSSKLAVLVAASLAIATTPSIAQTAPSPTTETIGEERTGFFQSDLMIMLAALVAAGVITYLATQIGGDDKDSPVSP